MTNGQLDNLIAMKTFDSSIAYKVIKLQTFEAINANKLTATKTNEMNRRENNFDSFSVLSICSTFVWRE